MEIQPIGMRVFTRTAREDYAWYPPVGRCELIIDLERLHRALVADQSADPSVFVLFGRRPRIGLIVGELLTDRMDHARTRIRNIFYVEGDQLQQPSLFRLAAELLGPSANEFKQALISYSERLGTESAAATNAIQFNIASIRRVAGGDLPVD